MSVEVFIVLECDVFMWHFTVITVYISGSLSLMAENSEHGRGSQIDSGAVI
jgi:hypothetical protein